MATSTKYEIHVRGQMRGMVADYIHTYNVATKPESIDAAKKVAEMDFLSIKEIHVVEVKETRSMVRYPLNFSN